MRPGHSVRCYFLCRSEGALRVWYEAVDDGRLVDTMLLIFNKLIGDEETVELDKVYNELNFGELQMEFVKDFGLIFGMIFQEICEVCVTHLFCNCFCCVISLSLSFLS